MKKMYWLVVCGLLACTFIVSCSRSNNNNNNLNYSVSESGNYFTIRAKYNRQRSAEIERFITNFFENNNNKISFRNTVIDADLTLDDGTNFYMKKEPGYLSIKFNKSENSTASYIEMKSLGNKLKTVLTKQ